ncbi:hypothetical protein, partial [Rhizobium leguminosarum]|uniref:hypothetical protein n=1 Tax=Rhizobium leguminosarum TaxID=384 RepID=UPI001AEBC5E2
KYGSIRRICASDNNSKSLIAGILSIRMNQSHCADASYLMGPEPSATAGATYFELLQLDRDYVGLSS